MHVACALAGAAVIASTPRAVARALFLGAAALALLIDLARLHRPAFRRYFDRALAPLLRPREKRQITGATTLAFGFAATVLLFPARAAMAGILYGGLADAAAAVVGRAFGRTRIRGGRTVEGSTAFYITALAIGILVTGLSTPTAALTALALALVELLPLPVDDNLFLPLLGALLTWLAVAWS